MSNEKEVRKLAVVNGEEITTEDLDRFKSFLAPEVLQRFSGEEGDKALTEELIAQELFYHDALDKGLDKDPDFLTALNYTRKSMLSQITIARAMEGLSVSDEDAQNYYDTNPLMFKRDFQVKASHILVKEEEEAKKIKKELDEGGHFAELAKQYSTCPSKAAGGDLGYFSKGMMVPAFEEVAFNLAVDEISEPVQTQFGYHIIVVKEQKEPFSQPFEEVKDKIKQHLLISKQNDVYKNKIEELNKKYKIERF